MGMEKGSLMESVFRAWLVAPFAGRSCRRPLAGGPSRGDGARNAPRSPFSSGNSRERSRSRTTGRQEIRKRAQFTSPGPFFEESPSC